MEFFDIINSNNNSNHYYGRGSLHNDSCSVPVTEQWSSLDISVICSATIANRLCGLGSLANALASPKGQGVMGVAGVAGTEGSRLAVRWMSTMSFFFVRRRRTSTTARIATSNTVCSCSRC